MQVFITLRRLNSRCYASNTDFPLVAVTGSAIKWMRDYEDDQNQHARGLGVYVVTAFSGLLAPYWEPAATCLLVRLDVIHDTSAYRARDARGERFPDARGDR